MPSFRRIFTAFLISAGFFWPAIPGASGAEAPSKESAEALEMWSKIRGGEGKSLSPEELEKKTVPFGKIDNQLCAAAAAGNLDELEYLLRDGVSPDSVDSLGISALAHAVLAGNRHAALQLLSAGADVNQKGPYGVTPLLLAANSRQKEMLTFLLLNGADRDLKSDDGETPLSLAERKGFTEIQSALQPPAPPETAPEKKPPVAQPELPEAAAAPAAVEISAPAEPATAADLALIDAAQHGRAEQAALLLQEGANPNVRPAAGISALIKAVERDDLKITQLLLRAGAEPDIRGQFNMTPLMMAAQGNQTEIARVLLRAGADPRAVNIVSQSACDLAAASFDAALQKVFAVCSQ